MQELESSDLVERGVDGTYRLGIATLVLGGAYAASPLVWTSADRVVRQLANETGESAYLGVLTGTTVVIQLGTEGRNAIVTSSIIGQRIPANCTAIGKALLAQLSDDEVSARFAAAPQGLTSRSIVDADQLLAELASIRSKGYATEDGEAHLALAGLAVSADSLVLSERRMVGIGVSMRSEVEAAKRECIRRALVEAKDRLNRNAAILAAFGKDSRPSFKPTPVPTGRLGQDGQRG
jgi:DNA-binding IclR family transcriptional regulator